MAAIPECVLKTRLSVGDGGVLVPSQLSDAKLIELMDEAPKCPEAFGEVIQEHERRLFRSPSYRDAFQKHMMQGIEQQEQGALRYDVFDIDQFYSLPLPSGGTFSKWVDRMQGEQCLRVIDVNQNGRPDDGDTCIGRNGGFYPDAKFVGEPLASSKAGKTCSNPTQWKRFGDCAVTYHDADFERSMASLREDAVGVAFDVHAPHKPEMFCMELAGSMQSYGGRMKDQAYGVAEAIVGSVEEHPVAAGAIVGVIGGLLAHPWTRGPTVAVLEWLGIGGAAVGAGGMIYDRGDALVQYAGDSDLDALQANMGDHDAEYLLLMSGGMMRGVTVPQAFTKLATGPERAAAVVVSGGRRALVAGDEFAAWFLGGGGGFGLEFAFEGAGAGGGGLSISLAAEGAGIAEGTAVAGGAMTLGVGLRPLGPLMMARTAVIRTAKGDFQLDIPDRFTPAAPWNGKAADLAKRIEGWMKDAAMADPSLEGAVAEVQSQLKAIREVYERVPDEGVRQAIVRELSDLYAALEDAVNSDASLGKIGALLRDGVRTKLDDILLEANVSVPRFSTFERIKPPKFKLPPEGSGIEIHPSAVKEINGSRPIAERMEDVYQIIDDFCAAGGDTRQIAADVEAWHGIRPLKKVSFHEGPGYRVFFVWNGNGRTAIVKAIPKPAPAAETVAAQTAWARAQELGYNTIFVLVIGEGVAEIIEVPR